MNNQNNALKTKPIAPKPNLTADLVRNHLDAEQPKTQVMTKEQVNAMFVPPAQVVNNFQMLTTPAFVRMAFSETDASGEAHTRAVLAFDYMTLYKLKDMIDGAIQRITDLGKQEAESHQVDTDAEKTPDSVEG